MSNARVTNLLKFVDKGDHFKWRQHANKDKSYG